MMPNELRELIDGALEGNLSEADFLRLEAELSVDPVARREYYDRVLLTTLLETEAVDSENDLPSIIRPGQSVHRWRLAFASMAAVSVCLVIVIAMQWLSQGSSPELAGESKTAEQEQQFSGYAILSGESNAVWNTQAQLAAGEIVPPGELHLRSGLAQFELFSGVTLVVEGDAKFSILSPMEVSVVSGKLRARVPEPAQGFRLLTEAGEVVDLGTEFAVNISDQQAEVHVLDGEIEWHPKGSTSRRMKQGDATRTNRQGQVTLTAEPQTFVGSLELQQRIRHRQQSRRQHWEEVCDSLSKDGRLIAHYQSSATNVAQRRLPNLATLNERHASEGAVVAATPTTNRWGDSLSALDFSPTGSRVRLQVPGEYQNLTLICWVRINSLDRWYNSLFLTDGHEKGEPHWQIMDDGRLFFSVKKNDVWDASQGEKDKHVFFSPQFWNASLSGRWLMLATVYDGTRGEVTHYLNGSALSREDIPKEYLVTEITIGDASLCNWGLPERDHPRFAIRNLNGCLDEFLMFSAPLTGPEIQELYQTSRP